MELGYNVKKINELITKIGSNCTDIRNAMQSVLNYGKVFKKIAIFLCKIYSQLENLG